MRKPMPYCEFYPPRRQSEHLKALLWLFVADLLVLDSPTLREDNDEANDLVFASVRKLVSRANRSQERRVEDLRRGPGKYSLFSARSNQRLKLQQSPNRLAIQNG